MSQAPACLLILLRSAAGDAALAPLRRRFALEFGDFTASELLPGAQWPAPDGIRARDGDALDGDPSMGPRVPHIQWLAFHEAVEPARLAPVQQHLWRVERLAGDAGARPPVALECALLTAGKVVRAAPADAPQRLDLGGGVFGEPALAWGGQPPAWIPYAWIAAGPRALAWLAACRAQWLRRTAEASRASQLHPEATPHG